jgi:hypothetical protein
MKKNTTEEKPILPHLVKVEVILEHLPIGRRTLDKLMALKSDPLPSTKIGNVLFFDLDEVANWWQRWKKRPRSEQEVLDVERKKARQRGRITVLSSG